MHLGRRPGRAASTTSCAPSTSACSAACSGPRLHDGQWRLADAAAPAWEGNAAHEQLIVVVVASGRAAPARRRSTTARAQAQCYVAARSWRGWQGRSFTLVDLLGDARYERSGDELAGGRLYLDMPAWGYNVFELQPQTSQN